MFLDCDRNPDNEIFIVEGRHAGNALRQVRHRQSQAVLAMQGKIPNPARHSNAKKILDNPQIRLLLQSLEVTNANVRFARIILLCDADIDGLHARALMTMFFAVHLPHLLELGCVFAVHPPLYRISSANLNAERYAWNKAQVQAIEAELESIGCADVHRDHFKGIASMRPEDLTTTCINAESRTISPITSADGAAVLTSFRRQSAKS